MERKILILSELIERIDSKEKDLVLFGIRNFIETEDNKIFDFYFHSRPGINLSRLEEDEFVIPVINECDDDHDQTIISIRDINSKFPYLNRFAVYDGTTDLYEVLPRKLGKEIIPVNYSYVDEKTFLDNVSDAKMTRVINQRKAEIDAKKY
jgi:hypothetical protein